MLFSFNFLVPRNWAILLIDVWGRSLSSIAPNAARLNEPRTSMGRVDLLGSMVEGGANDSDLGLGGDLRRFSRSAGKQTLPRQGSARVLAAQYPFKKQSCTAQVLQISTSSMQLIGSSNIRPSWSMASYNSTAMTAQVLHAFSCISNGCHALSALLLYILCLLAASLVSCFS